MSSTMKAALVLVALLLLAQVLELCAFLPNGGGARVTTTNALFRTSSSSSSWRHLPSIGHQTDAHSCHRHGGTISSTELYSSSNSNDGSSNKQKKKKGLDENLRNKLVTESIAPWRTVRLFLYFSCGSGALIGGLITLTGFVAALSNGNENLVVNTEVRKKFRTRRRTRERRMYSFAPKLRRLLTVSSFLKRITTAH
jgi:Low psii accumulation1 / Rep27